MLGQQYKRTCARRLTALLGVATVTLAGCRTAAVVPASPAPEGVYAGIWNAVPERVVTEPARERRILAFSRSEGFQHEAIEWTEVALRYMAQKTGAFEVTVSTEMEAFESSNLDRFDAVLLNNTTQLTFENPAHRRALLEFVRGGKGVIGIHAATDNFYDWPEAAEMMGGLFDGHPWHAAGTWAMKIDEPEHPLNRSFDGKGFLLGDEIYQIKGPYSRDTHRVLISLDMSNMRNHQVEGLNRDDGDFAISWIKPFGAGRVFYCSLGHNLEVLSNAAVLEHYLAGIQYALGDLEVDDGPSNALAVTPVAARTTDAGAVDDPFAAVVHLEFGDSRLAQAAIEQSIRNTAPESHASIEGRLIEVLENPASTYAAKQFVCRMLRRIGPNRSLPHLGRMLLDEELTDDARFALQGHESPEVDRILRESLSQLSGSALVGVVGTIGQRGDEQAVPQLVGMLDDANTDLSAAVIISLGEIGGAEAQRALLELEVSEWLERQRLDALLRTADDILVSGASTEARDVYERMTADEFSLAVRVAAWRGLVRSQQGEAMPSILALLRSDEPELQRAGARFAVEMQDVVDLMPLARELSSFSDEARVLAISALASAGVAGATRVVTASVESETAAVRTAAIRALGALGDVSHVPMLAAIAVRHEDSIPARESLVRLWGAGVDGRIILAVGEYRNHARAVLIDILALRYSAAAVPTFLSYAEDGDVSVRMASINALSDLAEDHRLVELIALLKRNEQSEERAALEEAIVAVVGRMIDREAGLGQILEAFDHGSETDRISLLRVLGNWPETSALNTLLECAESVASEDERTAAFAGVVNLMKLEHERTSAEDERILRSLFAAAATSEQKEVALDGLVGRPDVWVFELVEPLLPDPDLGEKAGIIRADLVEAVARTVSHDAVGAPVTLAFPYASQYDGGGDNALTDDRWGSTDPSDGTWQGFEGEDLDAVIDLGSLTEIHSLRAGFLEAIGSWIFLPREVTFSIAGEDRVFETVATLSVPAPTEWQPAKTQSYSTSLTDKTARYVRVVAKNFGTLPEWHSGAGGLAWLFADEIQINAHLER